MGKQFLGIDVGSVSVKFALLRGDELAGKVYLRNRGLIATVQEGLRQLLEGISRSYNSKPVNLLEGISGVGVTGSGKDFVKALVGGDYTDNEIMSHVIATQKQYPNVRTILDIGGEDSKLMLVRNGLLVDFQMNKCCAGGTGSMIETISNRLGVKVEDCGEIALRSKNPATLAGKCGIFAQSDAVSQLSRGRPTEDILMGVCKALVGNYLTVLAKGKKLLEPIVFQGAVAQNKAIVKAFEEALGKPILVPDNCAFMGAIGIAILTEENMDGHTRFRGDAVLDPKYRTEVGPCPNPCENNCELMTLYYGDEPLAVWGSHCGKYS